MNPDIDVVYWAVAHPLQDNLVFMPTHLPADFFTTKVSQSAYVPALKFIPHSEAVAWRLTHEDR